MPHASLHPNSDATRIVRCACEECGAHTNAISTQRIAGSCPTCGSFRLTALQGVAAILSAPLAP